MGKILHAISKGEYGGAQSSLLSYIRALPEYESHVIYGGADTHLNMLLRQVNVSQIAKYNILSSPFNLNFLTLFKHLRQLIKQNNYDYIITHSFVASIIIRLCLFGLPQKTTYVVHGFVGNANVPFRKRAIGLLLEFFTRSKVEKVIALSSSEKNNIQKIFKNLEILILPNTTYIGDLVSEIKAAANTDKNIILCLSRFAPPKRNKLIAEAFSASDLANSNLWELHFYGNGPELSNIQDRMKHSPNMKFYEPVLDVFQILSDAKILALFSNHEGLPMTILEAFALGTEVVCSDIEELREFEKYGFKYCLVSNSKHALIDYFNHIEQKMDDVEMRAKHNVATFHNALSPDKFSKRLNNFLA